MPAQRVDTPASSSGAERRRSERVLLGVRVEIAWKRSDGKQVNESAQTEVISAHGALLRTKTQIPAGTEVLLVHPTTHRPSRGRVVGTYPSEVDRSPRIAVELAVPSKDFWGIVF